MDINKDIFWTMIEEAKYWCGQDKEQFFQWIKAQLLKLEPEQSLNFHMIMHTYKNLANKYGLWSAASIMKETGCSDSGFGNFRAWLISQGKETYFDALKDPDSLSQIKVYGDCEFEKLTYVGDYAYEELTGRSAYDDCPIELEVRYQKELVKEIEYHPLLRFPLETTEMILVYPQLSAKYLYSFDRLYTHRNTWNTDLPEIRELLQEGKIAVKEVLEEKRAERAKRAGKFKNVAKVHKSSQ